jgi:VCBS repeat protein
MRKLFGLYYLLYCLIASCLVYANDNAAYWKRHVIDNSSQGADGIRLADANGDGLMDIATGWEEGGLIRVYFNPGPEKARQPWPKITVGNIASPEDAVLVDLNDDGQMDVVSCCEGKVCQVNIHWAPACWVEYGIETTWKTSPIPITQGQAQWMFCVPLQVDGKHGVDLVLGSKNKNAQVGWLEAPADPSKLDDWKWHPIIEAGWIMSIIDIDMDNDGDKDLLVSDRKGEAKGCYWLEHPGVDQLNDKWIRHSISLSDREFMFLDISDINGDRSLDVLVAQKAHQFLIYLSEDSALSSWKESVVEFSDNMGTGKSVRAGHINQDERIDIVVSCEGATKDKQGLFWMEGISNGAEPKWRHHPISGPEGIKFDLIELIDLDGDGDLDVLTCEERDNLGVIWYENQIYVQ